MGVVTHTHTHLFNELHGTHAHRFQDLKNLSFQETKPS